MDREVIVHSPDPATGFSRPLQGRRAPTESIFPKSAYALVCLGMGIPNVHLSGVFPRSGQIASSAVFVPVLLEAVVNCTSGISHSAQSVGLDGR
jgi:hypothetical protein